MSKETMTNKKGTPGERPKQNSKKGLFSRFLKWISTGTEKASRNGGLCNT